MDEAATELKLIAFDAEDLAVISAHVQDSCVQREEMTYLPAQKRFALAAMRYDWSAAAQGRHERVGAVLRFERVLKVVHIGLDRGDPDETLNLLAIGFEETDAPSGFVTLAFFGGAAVRLEVECLEAELRDIGPRSEAEVCLGHDAPPTGAGR
ncbi:MAG: DUF2948 family protein [Roseiarcus sp.]